LFWAIKLIVILSEKNRSFLDMKISLFPNFKGKIS